MVTLATDDFNRANGGLGANWSAAETEDALFPISVVSNAAANTTDGNDANSNYSNATWPNNQWTQAAVTASTGYSLGDGPGLGLRMSNTARTYYRVVFTHITGSNSVEIAKKVAGTYTMIAQRNSGAWTDGATWYAEIQGTTIVVKLNGTQVGTSATDSSIASGRTGLTYSSESASKTGTWDSWSGGDFTAGGGQDTPELYGMPFGSRGQSQMNQLLAQ